MPRQTLLWFTPARSSPVRQRSSSQAPPGGLPATPATHPSHKAAWTESPQQLTAFIGKRRNRSDPHDRRQFYKPGARRRSPTETEEGGVPGHLSQRSGSRALRKTCWVRKLPGVYLDSEQDLHTLQRDRHLEKLRHLEVSAPKKGIFHVEESPLILNLHLSFQP